MALTAGTISGLVMLYVWTCLVDTSSNRKNPLFARFFTSLEVLEFIAGTLPISFAPGLYAVLLASTPPTIAFFKSLPYDELNTWAVYVLLLEKRGARSRIYTGCGTHPIKGVRGRFGQYDAGSTLPRWVDEALRDGYKIRHKGLLCWMPIPNAATVPMARLLFYSIEGAFAYIFWAMRTFTGDYGMGHICPWGRHTLSYDGLCSHPVFNEGFVGDFDLSPDQLEAQAVELAAKRAQARKDASLAWYRRQIEQNGDEHRKKARERKAKYRANSHEKVLKDRSAIRAKDVAEHKHYCAVCKRAFTARAMLNKHLRGRRHQSRVDKAKGFRCEPCEMEFKAKQTFVRHQKCKAHLKAIKDGASSFELD